MGKKSDLYVIFSIFLPKCLLFILLFSLYIMRSMCKSSFGFNYDYLNNKIVAPFHISL